MTDLRVAINLANVNNQAIIGGTVTAANGLEITAVMTDFGDTEHTFAAKAISGASGGDVAVAVSLALNIVNVKTFALQSLRRRFYTGTQLHSKTKREKLSPTAQPNAMDSFAGGSPTAFARLAMAQRLRNALEALTADERALCEAFMAHGTWTLAAGEVGVMAGGT